MSIELHTVDNGNVQAINDGRLYGEFTGNVGGIVNGSVVTSAGGLALHVTSGWGIGYGRVFTITADDYTVQPASSGTQKGRLYVHIDISQPDNPIDIRSVAAASLPPLVQENLSEGGAIYEIELAHYDVTALAVSNLVSNSKIIIAPVPKSGGTFEGDVIAERTNEGERYLMAKNDWGRTAIDATVSKVGLFIGGTQYDTWAVYVPNGGTAVRYAGGYFDGDINAQNVYALSFSAPNMIGNKHAVKSGEFVEISAPNGGFFFFSYGNGANDYVIGKISTGSFVVIAGQTSPNITITHISNYRIRITNNFGFYVNVYSFGD